MEAKPKKEDLYLTRKTLLMRACDQKDQQAWEEFVAYYRPFIGIILRYLYVKEHDIDDLSQTVIINLWKKLDSFDHERCKFRTWLSTVIRNAVTTFRIKDNKDRNRDHKYFEANTKIPDAELEKVFDEKWKTYLTNVALENIKKNFSGKAIEVFLMSLNNTPIEEISEKLDLKENSVYRLRKRVQEQLMFEVKRLKKELEN